jgi:hypothetical protein
MRAIIGATLQSPPRCDLPTWRTTHVVVRVFKGKRQLLGLMHPTREL